MQEAVIAARPGVVRNGPVGSAGRNPVGSPVESPAMSMDVHMTD